MVNRLIKFIVLRPRGILQNLEVEVNCREFIKNVKRHIFSEDLKKEMNVRLIYMGKILDDKKRLEDYINYYHKDLLYNIKSSSSGIESKKDGSIGLNSLNRDINSKSVSNCSKENINNIPITIHVKITEKSVISNNDSVHGKNINTTLAQLSLLMFVSLLWMYRYNYAEVFPVFSSVVLCIFTVFIMSILFYTYIILFLKIFFKIMATLCHVIKQNVVRVFTYITQMKTKLFLKKEKRGGVATDVKEN
ncbi:hypothetical protein, conserved [Plasmodium gonderi]|uniref:Ubiquitin-like domain-containing protein n=1 Tax=Plasmodium gonderi TaxID=77519 RepID=A0A1Y1JER8_PLAGO|nr:hypothetical protein, conserved [Plasmodium gonderi]GAW81021.1 hypothetical protein, conserved [Plasmodium gonderi]